MSFHFLYFSYGPNTFVKRQISLQQMHIGNNALQILFYFKVKNKKKYFIYLQNIYNKFIHYFPNANKGLLKIQMYNEDIGLRMKIIYTI